MRNIRLLVLFAGILTGSTALAVENVTDLQQAWAHATYEMSADARGPALEELGQAATDLVATHPDDASLLIWQGIILSSYAGESSGFSALGAAKQARKALQKALEIDPGALDGSAYTSLGALYYKVPGWPIAFGDDKKARKYLEQALTFNPDGIDPNYFMGEYLLENGDAQAARAHLMKALSAPDRDGREVADAGRRREIQALMNQIAGTD
jgi:tetratricopeptide (TPR) repeat protein